MNSTKEQTSSAPILDELLPCPFCGSTSVVWSDAAFRVRCNSCFIGTPTANTVHWSACAKAELKARAIAEWNTRVSPEREALLTKFVKAARYALGCLEPITQLGHLPGGGESSGNWLHVIDAEKQLRAALTEYETQKNLGSAGNSV